MARDVIDYDKQYQEDLERAQALSLESLALEKFRNEKILKDLSTLAASSKTCKSTAGEVIFRAVCTE